VKTAQNSNTGKLVPAGALLLGAAIFVLSLASIKLTRGANFISILWPSNVVILVALARVSHSLRNYSFIFASGWIAIFSANVASGNNPGLAAELATANIVEVAVALAALIWLNATADFSRLRPLCIFVAVGALAPLFGATIGAAAVANAQAGTVSRIWVDWYASDALAMIILGPFMLAMSYERIQSLQMEKRYIEAFWILALVALISIFAAYYRAFIFILAPAILVAIFRFGIVGAAVAILTICLIGFVFIVKGIGVPVLSQPTVPERIFVLQIFLASMALWSFPVACVLAERDRLMAALDLANLRLQADNEKKSRMVIDLHRSLLNVEEEERLRLSHELHDQTGQPLAAALLELSALEKYKSAVQSDPIQRLRGQVEQTIQAMHRITWQLRPAAIDELGLARALGNYVSEWSEQFGIRADFQCDDDTRLDALSDEIRMTIYRIVGEALTNAAKHARGCRAVGVVITCTRSMLQLTVEDDGCGFDTAQVEVSANGGLGLAGIRERLSFIRGDFEIESSLGIGTTIFVRIPLSDSASGQ